MTESVDFLMGVIEACGALVSIVVAWTVQSSEARKTLSYRLFGALIQCNIVMMISAVAGRYLLAANLLLAFKLSRVVSFTSYFLTLAVFAAYLEAYINQALSEQNSGKVPQWFIRTQAALALIGAVLWLLSILDGFLFDVVTNEFSSGLAYTASQLPGVLSVVLDVGLVFAYGKYLKKVDKIALVSYVLLPFLTMVMPFSRELRSCLRHFMISLTILMIYCVIQVTESMEFHKRQAQLAIDRLQIVVSQVQPHFMYNVLNSLYYLVDKDPVLAKEVISKFSVYLRMNLDSLNSTEPILFRKELAHVDNYLYLEKMRYEDDLHIVYDCPVMDFRVPALSVQPLVENAVKHGIGKKENGGTVMISTREMEDEYQVIIADDGVGFDESAADDGKSHIGLDNVRERLRLMCHGSLEIRSCENLTEAILHIPKEKE